MPGLRIRAAEPRDLAFLVTGIRESERVPADGRTMYEAIFAMTTAEVERFLGETLRTGPADWGLSLERFLVSERAGTPVGACAAWVEAAHGVPSGHLAAIAISRFLGGTRWRASGTRVRALASSAPHRSAGALQLESFYTAPEARGLGVSARLIAQAIAHAMAGPGGPPIAEIGLLVENEAAARAYAKAGFAPAWRTAAPNPAFREATGSVGFVQLRRALP